MPVHGSPSDGFDRCANRLRNSRMRCSVHGLGVQELGSIGAILLSLFDWVYSIDSFGRNRAHGRMLSIRTPYDAKL